MGIGILAPVPAIFMRPAQVTCLVQGRVAFGSEAWEVFSRASEIYGQNIPVLIYPTAQHGDPDHLSRPGFATFCGIYVRTTRANERGKHPNPAIRPAIMLDGPMADTAWPFFWEIKDLMQLEKPCHVAITSLTAERLDQPFTNNFVLHGPTLVQAAFL